MACTLSTRNARFTAASALAVPPAGGTFRADGGRFALVGGRPYRMNAAALSTNVEYILANHLLEPYTPATPVPDGDVPARAALGNPYPNPFNPQVVIPFTLAKGGDVSLNVYDARGHLVRKLVDRPLAAGAQQLTWDGTDEAGRSVPSGTYFARLVDTGGAVRKASLVLVR